MTFAMMSAFFTAIACRHTGSPQDIKNVDLLCPHLEVLRKPMLKDKFAHAKRRHLQLVRLNMIMKFLRFQDVTEQIANAMIYIMLVYFSSLFFFFVCFSCYSLIYCIYISSNYRDPMTSANFLSSQRLFHRALFIKEFSCWQ